MLSGAFVRLHDTPGLTTGPISYNNGLVLAQSADLFSKERPVIIRDEQGIFRYFILYIATIFGRNDFILRIPALIFGILSLLYIYRLGNLLFGSGIGLLSSFLLSVSLWHIQHSNYAESYTLYSFLSLASVFYFCRGLADDKKGWQIKFIVSSILGFYSFYPFLVIILTELLWFLFRARHIKQRNKFLVSFLIIAALSLPAVKAIYEGAKWLHYSDSRWGLQGLNLSFNIISIFGGIKNFIPINIIIFLSGFLACLFYKERRLNGILLFLPVTGGILFFGYLSYLKFNIAGRYFLFIYPFFLIIASCGILAVRNKLVNTIFILLFCLSGILWVLHGYGYRTLKYIPEDYYRDYGDFKFLASYMEKNFREGDAVVVEQGPAIFALQYYLDTENKFPVKTILPACGGPHYYRYDGRKIKNLFGLTEHDHDPGRLKKLSGDYNRLWLIDLGQICFNDKGGRIRDWVDKNFKTREFFPGGIIYLFETEGQAKDEVQKSNYACDADTCFLSCGIKKEKEIVYPFQKIPFIHYLFLSGIKINNTDLGKLENEMFECMRSNMRADNGRKITVAITDLGRLIPKETKFTDNFMALNEWWMRYFAYRKKLPFRILPLSLNKNIFQDELLPDFVVSVQALSGIPRQVSGYYELLKSIVFSDGSSIYIYRLLHSFSFQWAEENAGYAGIGQAQDYFTDGQYDKCIELLEGLIASKGMNAKDKAICYVGLASSFVEKSISVRAEADKQAYQQKAESYFKAASGFLDDSDVLNISISSGLGFVYFQLGNLDKAIFYLEKGLKYPLGRFKKERIDIYTNLGYVYKNIGYIYKMKSRDYFKALSGTYPEKYPDLDDGLQQKKDKKTIRILLAYSVLLVLVSFYLFWLFGGR